MYPDAVDAERRVVEHRGSNRQAKLSAKSSEEMRSLKQLLRLNSFFVRSVKIQAIPACLVFAIQETSMKHKVVSGRGLDGWTVGAMGLDKGVGDRVYAISHSLAAVIALATVEIGLIDLCSKSRRFLDV